MSLSKDIVDAKGIEVASSFNDISRVISIKNGSLEKVWDGESNGIMTAHYSLWSFIPLCFTEQCLKPANFYFICIAVLQCIPGISNTDGKPSMALPLTFVIGVSMLKCGFEDYNRHKADNKTNATKYSRLRMSAEEMEAGLIREEKRRSRTANSENPLSTQVKITPGIGFVSKCRCDEIQVGDIVIIHDGDEIPADMLLIGRFHKKDEAKPKMFCHLETANVDGETNLKVKTVPPGLNTLSQEIAGTVHANQKRVTGKEARYWQRLRKSTKNLLVDPKFIRWMSAKPNKKSLRNKAETIFQDYSMEVGIPENDGILDEFKGGYLSLNKINDPKGEKIPLDFDNFLLRGCKLANSGYIYGLALYIGPDCKIFRNTKSGSSKAKTGQVEQVMNSMLIVLGGIMLVVCVISAIGSGLWCAANADTHWYIALNANPVEEAFMRFFTWLIVFCQFIPISLLVSIETMRVFQSIKMYHDDKICRKVIVNQTEREMRCMAQQSAMNEDLGRVEFVFSDKTGTLTENVLTYRQACIPGVGRIGGGVTQIAWMNMKKKGQLLNIQRQKRIVMEQCRITEKEAAAFLHESSGNIAKAVELCEAGKVENASVAMDLPTQALLLSYLKTSISHDLLNKLDPFEVSAPPIPPKPDRDSTGELNKTTALNIELFLRGLVLNNDVFPVYDEEKDEIEYNASTPDDVCMVAFTKYAGMELCPYSKPFKTLQLDLSGQLASDNNVYKSLNNEVWEELQLLPFSSAKKRMSVVCRLREANGRISHNKNVYVFVKGADSTVKEIVNKASLKNYNEYYNQTTNDFADEGLRTLLCGYAVHTLEWWEKWEPRFKERLSYEERDLLEQEFDAKCDYYICGVTAVEDKLQDEVPGTIEKLLQAGVRTWMLTGDKRETAINIGIACNLLSVDLTHRILMTPANCVQVLEDFYKENSARMEKATKLGVQPENPPIELVLEGLALREIFHEHDKRVAVYEAKDELIPDDENLINIFTELALVCKAVVSCRLQPNQKAQIVDCIKEKTGLITLAIGDGANDVPMIKTAGIGVGLQGLEGTSAARSADYVISRFKFLKRLLFVHGRNSYKGTTYMILYLFWKNAMVCFINLYISFYVGFSGQLPYHWLLYQIYNTFPTGILIFAYVLYDNDISPDLLESFPLIYGESNGNVDQPKDLKSVEKNQQIRSKMIHFQGGKLFNLHGIMWKLVEAAVQGACILFPVQYIIQESKGIDIDGHSVGFFFATTFWWPSMVFISNVKLALSCEGWSHYHTLACSVSVMVSLMALIITDMSNGWGLGGFSYFNLLSFCFGSTTWWYVIIMSWGAGLLSCLVPQTYYQIFQHDKTIVYKIATKELRSNYFSWESFNCWSRKTVDDDELDGETTT